MQSLAVNYRPQSFEEVCGQTSIVTVLQKQLETKTFKNAYLFAGPSGCGKTTIARIFALELNKYQLPDKTWASSNPIEIDGASNNGVENVRNIILGASERSLDGKYKVFIIDEAHGLSNAAWQAFLKCIEEPPEYTIFIFCTTDPQKIPATIFNRVMRFNFSRIAPELIEKRLVNICEQEGYTNYQEACEYIARTGNGGMRDAIALLEKAADFSTDLSLNIILDILGDCSYETLFSLLDAIISGGEEQENFILSTIENIFNTGKDLRRFLDQFFMFVIEVSKYANSNHNIDMTSFPERYQDILDQKFIFSDQNSTKEYYSYLMRNLLNLKTSLKFDTTVKASIEVGLLELSRCHQIYS